MTAQRKIGIALSGGGSRAIAFHLGCLRALHDLGLLNQASVLSTVSGGSVIGALYATSDGSFPEFEVRVRQLLRGGLFWPSVRAAITTNEGAKIITSFVLSGAVRLLTVPTAWVASVFQLVFSDKSRRHQQWLTGHSTIRRFASRTTLLRHVLNTNVFSRRRLADL